MLRMLAILTLMITVYILIRNTRHSMKIIRAKDCSFNKLTLHFKQKIWMTLGLGISFGLLYLLGLYLSSKVLTQANFLWMFHLGQEHLGLLYLLAPLFVIFNALLIWGIRNVLKVLYIKLNK
jgi:hypothetical protein